MTNMECLKEIIKANKLTLSYFTSTREEHPFTFKVFSEGIPKLESLLSESEDTVVSAACLKDIRLIDLSSIPRDEKKLAKNIMLHIPHDFPHDEVARTELWKALIRD